MAQPPWSGRQNGRGRRPGHKRSMPARPADMRVGRQVLASDPDESAAASSLDRSSDDGCDGPARRFAGRGRPQRGVFPMRIVVLSVLSSLLLLCGCGSSSHQQQQNGFSAPNSLMSQEIDSRIDQIPYQHREELLQNLLWLSQSGEQTIPALLKGLSHDNPKVRSSCAWVLGRMRDRRVINDMEKHASDQSETVRLEVCRTLVVLGDLKFSPMLIEGLDSDHKEVRFLCHEALKSSTGRDFGYDHLSEDATQRRTAVLGWRQWWSEYSGDPFFAQNYMQRYG